jgi:hypothetical protein
VLWEALTGERLFRAENEGHLVEQVLFRAPPAPSTRRPDIPAALDAVIMRGLSRERADRFATAKEMAIALASAAVPASTPEVGEWVEARALDALEKRAKLVAAVEAHEPAEGSAVRAVRAESAAAVPPRGGRARPAIIGGVLVVAALLIGYGLRAYATPSPVAPVASDEPASRPTPPPPSATATAAETNAAPSASPSGSASTRATAENNPPRVPTAGTTQARGVTRGKASAPTPKTACQRRGADGEIEFDIQCLRASQHTL